MLTPDVTWDGARDLDNVMGRLLQGLVARQSRWSMALRAVGYTAVAIATLCLSGCLEEAPPSSNRPGTSLASAAASPVLPVDGVWAEVVEVIDGDTVRVRVDETHHTVRYIGIDAPERDEPLGPAATEANRALVVDRTVLLERDVSDMDDYGRWLRYVYLPDAVFVNAELVRQGMARAKAYPPDLSRQAELTLMEEEARAAARGLWEPASANTVPGQGRVRILGVDKQAEVVVLTNVGDQSQDLTGWTLISERGGEVCPLHGSLQAGATLDVWARAEDAYRGGHNCGFDHNIWNNSQPDPAALYDAGGRLVDIYP